MKAVRSTRSAYIATILVIVILLLLGVSIVVQRFMPINSMTLTASAKTAAALSTFEVGQKVSLSGQIYMGYAFVGSKEVPFFSFYWHDGEKYFDLEIPPNIEIPSSLQRVTVTGTWLRIPKGNIHGVIEVESITNAKE